MVECEGTACGREATRDVDIRADVGRAFGGQSHYKMVHRHYCEECLDAARHRDFSAVVRVRPRKPSSDRRGTE